MESEQCCHVAVISTDHGHDHRDRRLGECPMNTWEQGSSGGTVVRTLASHLCGSGSIPGLGIICGLSLLLFLVLPPRGFSPGTPVFLFPQKPKFPNSNSIWRVSPISAQR